MKIIIPIDFSDNSLNALDFAIALAKKKDSEIILVHVIEAVFDFASQASIALENMQEEAKSLMQKILENQIDPQLKFTSIIKEGTASISVTRVAMELDATLIVMGTQGANSLKTALFGSTTINMIKESSIPVLAVPARSTISEVKKIVLALEFANREYKFIDWVITMSQRWELGMEFVHIQTDADTEEESKIKQLEDFVASHYHGLPMKIHTFYADSPVEGLDQFLEENDKVILVMCHQHKNLWEQILSSSQTIEMVFHSKVPLLVMP